jgi:hypothetical protein
MQGWIKFYREVLGTDLWYDVTTFRLFTYLLLNATHQDGIKKGGVELKRGQWIRSYRKLAQDLAYKEGRGVKEYSIKTISKCVKKLVDAGTITVEETKQGTLFTIVNYAKYQDKQELKKETGNASGNEQETNGERSGNNNKNGKNGENGKKDINTTQEIKDLLAVFNEKIPGFVDLNKQYWDVIRETRKTGKISKNVIRNNMKKWERYDPVVIQYALMTHIQNHAGKREEYTIGIMRRTNEHEARRGLIKLKNKGGSLHGITQPSLSAVGENTSSTRAEAQRLEELARSKGLIDGALRDTEFDF